MGIQKLETSVIVIGAGPAGAGTSFFLSKFGIPHIVIEKALFPRDKVCGDACSGKAAVVIERANPEWLQEMLGDPGKFLPSNGLVFGAPNGRTMAIPINTDKRNGAPPNFIVPRLVFDNFLFEKMSSSFCTVLQEADVTNIIRNEGRVEVRMTRKGQDYLVTAPIVIGADGDKSIVKKHLLSGHAVSKTTSVGLRAYYKGVEDMHSDNFIELHFLPEIMPGYLWIFPLPGGMANVGVGSMSDSIRKKKVNLREQMLYAIKHNPSLAPRFANARLIGDIKGYGLPLFEGEKPVSGANFMLTGDAASLIDPFSGEGIGNAMYSGMIAAGAAKKALEKNNYSASYLKEVYDDFLYTCVGPELRRSAKIQQLCKYPWLFNLVVNKANKSATLRKTLTAAFSDTDLQEELSNPLFYLKMLFNR